VKEKQNPEDAKGIPSSKEKREEAEHFGNVKTNPLKTGRGKPTRRGIRVWAGEEGGDDVFLGKKKGVRITDQKRRRKTYRELWNKQRK